MKRLTSAQLFAAPKSTEFRRSLRDSDIAISILPWIERGGHESGSDAVRLDFDRRLMLQFRGSVVTSDGGLLAYRELDDVLGLTEMAGDVLADARSGKNGRHALAGLFRQSGFGRLAAYEDVNDAQRLPPDPPLRCIVTPQPAPTTAPSPQPT